MPKGQLIGITEEELERVRADTWMHARLGTDTDTANRVAQLAVAHEAQVAMLNEIDGLMDSMQDTITREWYVEIEQKKWEAIKTRLGVTE